VTNNIIGDGCYFCQFIFRIKSLEVIFLTEDIRNASNYATYQFKGDPDSVEFSSVGYSWTGNKQVPRGSRTPNRIRFRFLSDKNSVYRFQENHFQTLNPKNKLTKVTAIANNIVSHQFEYYYAVKYFAYEWRNHWEDVCFPNAVKVSVQYQEYDQLRVISKIISIPHGRCLV